jgi:uncharacterized repeat protein (TIGR03803 family)
MGIAVLLLWPVTGIVSSAQTFVTLFTFDGTDGSLPVGILTQGIDGNFYGVTEDGGTGLGEGTAFKVTPTGGFTTLYDFCGKAMCVDGNEPSWGVVLGTDGNFHGTTGYGGPNQGEGTVYTLTSGGKQTVISSFNGTDGSQPEGVIEGIDGNYYGTTIGGGNAVFCSTGSCGVVFKITPSGTTTTIYNFCSQPNCTDGMPPTTPLVQGTDGNFYGTTAGFDTIFPTIFKLTPSGKLTTLYTFTAEDNGVSGLILATDGNFYGTTHAGGANGLGAVFEITPKGQFSVLHSFCANFGCTDGADPLGGVVQGSDGNFYGTTSEGGQNGGDNQGGVIFRLSPSGTYTVLYNFCSQANCADGYFPTAGPTQGSDGNFYGTTSGGNQVQGTIYSLSIGLGPFVKFLPGGGKVGSEVGILGNSLNGTTAVTFDGTSAKFNVVSSTLILTHVPTGARSGLIRVMLPGGTLSSNAPFEVIP